MKIEEIKKMDAAAITKKIEELKKDIFDNRQKAFSGELKDSSVIGKAKKDIARLMTVLNAAGPVVEEKKEA